MTINYNANIVSSDLLLNLDAGNSRSLSGVDSNLLTSPEDFSNAVWNKGNITVVANSTASPDGSMTADAMVETTTATAFHYINQTISKPAISSTFTFSCYIKNLSNNRLVTLRFEDALAGNGMTSVFSPMLGTVTSAIAAYGTGFTAISSTITPVSNGYYRVSITGTTNTTNSVFVQVELSTLVTNVYTGDVLSGTYLWGAQLEEGSAATTYYPVNSSRPSTAWLDISGNNFHGTLINGPTYASTNRGYLNFNYTKSQYVSFPKNPAIEFLNTSPYTLESWFRITVNPGTGNYTGIFDREDSSVGAVRDGWNLYVVEQSAGILSITHERFSQGTQSGVGTTGTVAELVGVWVHIAATYNGNTLSMYKNGSLASSGTTTALVKNNIKNLTIGFRGGNYFRGQIAVARIYSRALSATEVLQNFNALRGRYGV